MGSATGPHARNDRAQRPQVPFEKASGDSRRRLRQRVGPGRRAHKAPVSGGAWTFRLGAWRSESADETR